MSRNVARWFSWSIGGLSVAMSVAGLVVSILAILATRDPLGLYTHVITLPLIVIMFSVLGPLVVARHPRHPIGWIMTLTSILSGVVVLVAALLPYGERVLGPERAPWLALVKWLDLWLWIPSNVLPLTFLILLFPDGHLPSSRWQPVTWAVAFGMLGTMIGSALNPLRRLDSQGNSLEPNPFGLPSAGPAMDALLNLAGVILILAILASVASLFIRFRRSGAIQRQQLKWMAYATAFLILSMLVSLVLYAAFGQNNQATQIGATVTGFGFFGIALAATIAILRYRLFDIDIVINRTLVYGGLTTAVVGLYVFIVGYLGTLLHVPGEAHQATDLIISLIATGIVAVLFQPLRDRLQRAVNRMMYGERDDPYAVLSRLGQRLEATLAPEAVLPTIVETVAQTLKLSCVAIALKEASADNFKIVAASSPNAFSHPATPGNYDRGAAFAVSPLSRSDPTLGEHLPLVYQGELIGQLIFSPRAPSESFTPAERRLLGDIAHQASVAAHAVRLTADLQRSRERIVTAREEERRRLRRDLHDGLGPALASLTLKLDAARNLLIRDPEAVDTLLVELKAQTQAAVADIRRLAYDLRPPALDELGLASAIREYVTSQPADGLHITVEAPESLPPLPAAVEVAAYRIALEALTNVIRHANARECVIRVSLSDAYALSPLSRSDPTLQVEVTDNGIGLKAHTRAGVGLTSMRERAVELGGTCAIERLPTGGTCVLARLPLSTAEK